jgi:Helix-turn-helix domain of resolvase
MAVAVSEERLARVGELHEAGMAQEAIALEVGTSRRSVDRALTALGRGSGAQRGSRARQARYEREAALVASVDGKMHRAVAAELGWSVSYLTEVADREPAVGFRVAGLGMRRFYTAADVAEIRARHARRKREHEERQQSQRQKAKQLYAAEGRSLAEAAPELGVRPQTVRWYLIQEGVTLRPRLDALRAVKARQTAAWLEPLKKELAGTLSWSCDEPDCDEPALIAARDWKTWGWVKDQPLRFCRIHARHGLARSIAKQIEEANQRGYLTGVQAAERLHLASIASRPIAPDGRTPHFNLYLPDTLDTADREWARGIDSSRQGWPREWGPKRIEAAYFSLERLESLAERHGIRKALEMKAAALERAERRMRKLRRRTAGRRAAGYVGEWAERFNSIRQNYESHSYGDGSMPSDWRLYLEVAIEDYCEHPERWSYNPAEQPRPARNRVSMALKSAANRAQRMPIA